MGQAPRRSRPRSGASASASRTRRPARTGRPELLRRPAERAHPVYACRRNARRRLELWPARIGGTAHARVERRHLPRPPDRPGALPRRLPVLGFDALPEAGLLLYFQDFPDRRQLRAQPLAEPFDPAIGRDLGGATGTGAASSAPTPPDQNGLLLIGDESNDEVLNVYRLSLEDGALARLTDVPYVNAFQISPDDRRLAYVARFQDGPRLSAELRVRDLASGRRRCRVGPAELRLSWGSLLWRNDRELLATVLVDGDRNRSNFARVRLEAPSLEPLLDTAPPRPSSTRCASGSSEREVAMVSNESGYAQLYRLDVETGAAAG